VEAADAAADNGAAAEGVLPAEVQAAVLDGREGRHHRELREAVQAARQPRVQDRLGFEVLDLAPELDLEGSRVELLDRADAAPAGAQPLPVAGQVRRQRIDRAHARDDDAPRHFLASSLSM